MAIQRLNKKGFSMRDFIPSLIIFSLVIGVFSLMVLYEGYNYGNPSIIDSHYNNTYNKLQSLQGNVQTMYNQSNPTTNPGGFELLGAFGTVFKAMISVIGLIFDSLTGLSSQVGSIGQDIGMPSVLANLIFPAFLAIITVIIVLIVINASKFGKL